VNRRIAIVCTLILAPHAAHAAESLRTLDVQDNQVAVWNRFADNLVELQRRALQERPVRIEQHTAHYGGEAWADVTYTDQTLVDAASGRVLARLRYESTHPDKVNIVEVNVYDDAGRLARDYTAAYLPMYRNAPVQTLINLHAWHGELHAYRQFDASGVRIYEQCRGRLGADSVDISLTEERIPASASALGSPDAARKYQACFDGLPDQAGTWLDPRNELRTAGPAADAAPTLEQAQAAVAALDQRIAAEPAKAAHYLERGRLRSQLHDFDGAVADLDRAIELGDLDEAWFWRGMARGRARDVAGGIADLTVYIQRHPDSSVAHTKRGVRRIWAGDLPGARADLERAVALDARNSEAHDDLGVVLAQQGDHDGALAHFEAALRHDPTYAKAWHNRALVQHLRGDDTAGLEAVNRVLALDPEARDSLLLKATILTALGREQEARAINALAELLPEGNWSERSAIR